MALSMPGAVFASLTAEEAMKAYHEKRYAEALPLFLNVLSENPRDPAVHNHLTLILKEIGRREKNRVQEDRLDILGQASRRLESGRLDAAPIQAAILETTQAEQREREERWQAWCEQAEADMQMGHLFEAHDRVLRVLAENPRHILAQRQLSDLQIRLRKALDEKTAAAPEERFAWQGFYAYGQADFDSAVAAWAKSLDIIRQSYDRATALQHLAALKFGAYYRAAQARVEKNREIARSHALFSQASEALSHHHFKDAVQLFHSLAVIDPAYSHLKESLARAEAGLEQERAMRLGESKRQDVSRFVDQGKEALSRGLYTDAERYFVHALAVDPDHSTAKDYLSMVRSEIHLRHDPKAAQRHYEAGLVAYAAGKLDDAVREWTIAIRMNPGHVKASNALSKVQKELALNREVP